MDDEYVVGWMSRFNLIPESSLSNCAGSKKTSGWQTLYRDYFAGCTYADYFRPSVTGNMADPDILKSSVWNCGLILKKIFPGSSKESYFKNCMHMDTIKPGDECLSAYDCATNLNGWQTRCSMCNNRKCVSKSGEICMWMDRYGRCDSAGKCINDPNIECINDQECSGGRRCVSNKCV